MAEEQVSFLLSVRDEASAALQNVAGGLGNLHDALGGLATAAGGLGAIAVGVAAIGTAMTVAGVAFDSQVQQLKLQSETTGVSVDKLQALRQTLQDAGADSEVLTTALFRLNRAIGEGYPLLHKLGITSHDTWTVFTQLVDIFSRSEDATKKDAIAMQLMGRGARDLTGAMSEVKQNFAGTYEELGKLGGRIDDSTVKSIMPLHDNLRQLHAETASLKVQFEEFSAPLATQMVKNLSDGIEWIKKFGAAWKDEFDTAIGKGLDSDIDKLDQFNDRLKKAKEEAARVGGSVQIGVPTIEGVTVSATRHDPLAHVDPKMGAGHESEREKEIKKITEALHVGRAEAEQFYAQLHAIDEDKQADEMLKKLGLIEKAPKGITGAPSGAERPTEAPGGAPVPTFGPGSPAGVAEFKKAMQDQRAAAEHAFQDIFDRYDAMVNQMLSSTAILDDSLNAAWGGIQAGFSQALQIMTAGTHSFADAGKAIISSMVDAMLQELEKLAEAWVFKALLNFIAPGFGAVAGSAGDALMNAGNSFPTAMRPAAGGAAAAAAGGGTFNVTVQAIDAASAARSLQDPHGTLRVAMQQVALAGAVG